MDLLNPQKFQSQHPDPRTRELMSEVIGWFERKGLKSLKEDWHQKTWNYSFVEFMREHQVLATLMTPEGYGEGAQWDTLRNVEFAEIVAFYGITYWYTFQVSMLGLGPIEPLLKDATVTDILVNTYNSVFVERAGRIDFILMQS